MIKRSYVDEFGEPEYWPKSPRLSEMTTCAAYLIANTPRMSRKPIVECDYCARVIGDVSECPGCGAPVK
jgi:hypothetical protein